jgi:hypothetical protein
MVGALFHAQRTDCTYSVAVLGPLAAHADVPFCAWVHYLRVRVLGRAICIASLWPDSYPGPYPVKD